MTAPHGTAQPERGREGVEHLPVTVGSLPFTPVSGVGSSRGNGSERSSGCAVPTTTPTSSSTYGVHHNAWHPASARPSARASVASHACSSSKRQAGSGLGAEAVAEYAGRVSQSAALLLEGSASSSCSRLVGSGADEEPEED